MTTHNPNQLFGHLIIRNFLDSQTCAAIRAEARTVAGSPAPVYIEGEPNPVNEAVRKTTSLRLSDETIAFVEGRMMAEMPTLEAHFNLTLTDCEKPQFLRYREGDFFVRHQDGNTENLEFDHLRIRKISIVVFLNHSSETPAPETFGGGELIFYRERDELCETPLAYPVPSETGLLVAFNAETIHEVTPVIHGERLTIINWFR